MHTSSNGRSMIQPTGVHPLGIGEELRTRLVWAVVSFLICFVICFFFAKPIFTFLTRPLHEALAGQANDHLIYTALTEVFFTNVKIGA